MIVELPNFKESISIQKGSSFINHDESIILLNLYNNIIWFNFIGALLLYTAIY